MINIAIDGPSGAGKSTTAKAVASRLGYIYVDTGALYRTIALHVIRSKGDTANADFICQLLSNVKIELQYQDGVQQVLLNGENVSDLIRTPVISMGASAVSAVPQVRAFLLSLQRDIAKSNNVIMDGRDIGTVILPDAQVKVFLTATPECRAQRRYKELLAKGQTVQYEVVLKEIVERDYNDSHREIAPLKPTQESIIFDSTGYSLEASTEKLLLIIKETLA